MFTFVYCALAEDMAVRLRLLAFVEALGPILCTSARRSYFSTIFRSMAWSNVSETPKAANKKQRAEADPASHVMYEAPKSIHSP